MVALETATFYGALYMGGFGVTLYAEPAFFYGKGGVMPYFNNESSFLSQFQGERSVFTVHSAQRYARNLQRWRACIFEVSCERGTKTSVGEKRREEGERREKKEEKKKRRKKSCIVAVMCGTRKRL